jgi:hypothetical protein
MNDDNKYKNNDRRAESARIRANADYFHIKLRWPATIAAILMLSGCLLGLVSGEGRDFRSVGTFLLPGLFLTFSAVWGWRVHLKK